jgi:SNF2 family DNA or RNA helicase
MAGFFKEIPPPFKHQTKSTNFIHDVKRVLDFSDPGTGKTRSSIDAIKLHREDNGGKVIVTAPKAILQSAWGNDIDTFVPGMKYSVASAKNREEAFAADVDVVITNHDAVKWAFQNKKVLKGFDGIINDESTAFKHRTSQRSKQLYKLIKHFDFVMRVNLTGTPNPNGVQDLWHQVLMLDDGEHLGNSFFKYRNSVCEPVQTGPRPEMVDWVDKEGAEDAIADILEDMTIRNKFEDCTDIPPNSLHTVNFTLSRKHRTQYEALRSDALLQLENGVVTAMHAASLTTKLLQLASGAVYDEDKLAIEINNDRAELVLELAAQREQCVIAFNWVHQRDALLKECERRGFSYAVIDGGTKDTDVPIIVDRFQAGKTKIIFAQPQSAAHGLTLTKGTTTIWASPTYNAEHFNQFNRRIYRTGQTRKTETLMVCAIDTLEEQVYEKLQGKVARMGNLLDLLQTSIPQEKAA